MTNPTEVLRDVIDVTESESFSKFKLLKPEFAFFLTLTVSVVPVTSSRTFMPTACASPVAWVFWIWSSQYHLES